MIVELISGSRLTPTTLKGATPQGAICCATLFMQGKGPVHQRHKCCFYHLIGYQPSVLSCLGVKVASPTETPDAGEVLGSSRRLQGGHPYCCRVWLEKRDVERQQPAANQADGRTTPHRMAKLRACKIMTLYIHSSAPSEMCHRDCLIRLLRVECGQRCSTLKGDLGGRSIARKSNF